MLQEFFRIFFFIAQMMLNIATNIPFIGPVIGHWIKVFRGALTITNIAKGTAMLGMTVGLIVGLGLLILLQGPVWALILLFIKGLVSAESWTKYESYLKIIYKILAGISFLYLVGAFASFILYIIIALPDLLLMLIKFIVKEAVPMIIEMVMDILFDDSNPIGFMFSAIACMFGSCPKPKKETITDLCNSKLDVAYKLLVQSTYVSCEEDSESDKCKDLKEKVDEDEKAKEQYDKYSKCMEASQATSSDAFSKAFDFSNPEDMGKGLEDMGKNIGKGVLENISTPFSSSNNENFAVENFTNWV